MELISAVFNSYSKFFGIGQSLRNSFKWLSVHFCCDSEGRVCRCSVRARTRVHCCVVWRSAIGLAWVTLLPATVAHSSLPSPPPGWNHIHSPILLTHLLFIYLPVTTHNNLLAWPTGPKWLPLESQLPAVVIPWQFPFEFNRHTVMSQVHPCLCCHFKFQNKNRIKSDCWSHVVCDKNEK